MMMVMLMVVVSRRYDDPSVPMMMVTMTLGLSRLHFVTCRDGGVIDSLQGSHCIRNRF
jgi:hypothetical protein